MFDAKSLLSMVLGAAQQAGGQQGGQGGGQAGGLGGMIGNVLSGLQNQAGQANAGAGGLAGGLGGMLSGLQGKAQEMAQNAQGGMNSTVADALAQAQEAVRTGNYAALTEQAKGFLQGNAGGLLLGGLAGLALGTKGGRSLVGTAAKLGGLALVGGLAYKAWQNYQSGQPAEVAGTGAVLPAPQGSGYAEGDGDDNERALLMVRAMIAAAAADGVVDDAERARIMGNLQQAGLSDEAAGFLDQELANPMDASASCSWSRRRSRRRRSIRRPRLAIDPDDESEQTFLADLASASGSTRSWWRISTPPPSR